MESLEAQNLNTNPKTTNGNPKKPKVVIIMGATGAGKSKLAIDLASHFPIEIINADSMQVYKGLDVLTNKVPIQDQKGVPHHLLGTVDPNVEFTSKDFRDSAIGIIEDILSRDRLPVIVGGTNYYIQALVSPFLLDELGEDIDDCSSNNSLGDNNKLQLRSNASSTGYGLLIELDPVAAKRIHPNDYRKVNQYLSLYSRSGVLPSELFQGKALEKWGRVDNFRYNCCFICVDASLPVLDHYVEQRVDCMISAGLLNEVYDIYNLSADYTRGLRQAIGVREFEHFLRFYLPSTRSNILINDENKGTSSGVGIPISMKSEERLKQDLKRILDSADSERKVLLNEAIDKVKTNTKRLVRRQKRRLSRLQTIFGWDIHHVDATEALLGNTNDPWPRQVVDPSVKFIKSFLNDDDTLVQNIVNDMVLQRLNERDLWTQHICEACGNKILRGSHEWEQHKQGRGHRKRILRLKKSKQFLVDRAEATTMTASDTIEGTQAYPTC